MALQRQVLFPYLTMIIVSIISGSTSSLHGDSPHDFDRLEEYGYDFEAYPSSYLSSDIIEEDNDQGVGRVLASATTVSVDHYGAKGDGSSDDTQAFKKAWSNACSSKSAAVFLVPQKTYLVKPITFPGPCNSGITVQIYGTIEASADRADYSKDGKHWLLFDSVQNLVVQGGGTINGNGKIWWQNSCKINKALPCKNAPTMVLCGWCTIPNCAPSVRLTIEWSKSHLDNEQFRYATRCRWDLDRCIAKQTAQTQCYETVHHLHNTISQALTFYNCKNVKANNLKIQNGQQIHVSFEKCVNVQASNLKVTAPENSPNTDGIHVTNTQNIRISSCVIGTGDDCISIVSGSQKVQATDITCGPGHGISIGSLGSGNSEAYVSDVVVNGAKLSGTTNGVRIKTWQGGSGSVSNIKFQNVEMYDVSNPIIIDQNYCDQKTPCQPQSSAVQVKNVLYQNIKGTSASNVAITFACSKRFPCQGIVLQNVDIEKRGGGAAKAICNNVKTSAVGVLSPHCP